MTFTAFTNEQAVEAIKVFKTVDALRNTIIFNRLNKGLIPEIAGLDADAAVMKALCDEDTHKAVMEFRLAYEARKTALSDERKKAMVEARKQTALRTQAVAIKSAIARGLDVNMEAYIISKPEIVPHLVELGVYSTK